MKFQILLESRSIPNTIAKAIMDKIFKNIKESILEDNLIELIKTDKCEINFLFSPQYLKRFRSTPPIQVYDKEIARYTDVIKANIEISDFPTGAYGKNTKVKFDGCNKFCIFEIFIKVKLNKDYILKNANASNAMSTIKSALSLELENVKSKMYEYLAHELSHLVNPSTKKSDDIVQYLTEPSEMESMVTGLMQIAKGRKLDIFKLVAKKIENYISQMTVSDPSKREQISDSIIRKYMKYMEEKYPYLKGSNYESKRNSKQKISV